jgi:hypothetical protein
MGVRGETVLAEYVVSNVFLNVVTFLILNVQRDYL